MKTTGGLKPPVSIDAFYFRIWRNRNQMYSDRPSKVVAGNPSALVCIAAAAILTVLLPIAIWLLVRSIEYNARQTAYVVSERIGCDISYRDLLSRRQGIYFIDCDTVADVAKAHQIRSYSVTKRKEITVEYELNGEKHRAKTFLWAPETDSYHSGQTVSIARMGNPRQAIRLIDQGRTWFSDLAQIAVWLSIIVLTVWLAFAVRSPFSTITNRNGAR
jgi:hypothetical protein